MKCLPKSFTERSKLSPAGVSAACAVFLAAAFVASLLWGSTPIGLSEFWEVLRGHGDNAIKIILLHVRLPRALAALLAGCALSASGCIIQSVMGNPLAGPNLIGVNAGAGLAVVLCTAFLPCGHWAVSGAAFLGALGTMLLIYFSARAIGASRITLILAGIAVSNIFSACIDAVVTFAPDALAGVSYFRIGSLEGAAMDKLLFPAVYIFLALVLLFFLCNEMDILALGEDVARSLGMHVAWCRFLLLFIAAMLAGAAVSFCGLLGFVGLIVPHAVRFLVGSESRRLLPAAVMAGGGFLLLCDVLSRVLFAPYELPVGIIMSFFGGPFFLWLLISKKGGHTGGD